jgi:hypothetical protein
MFKHIATKVTPSQLVYGQEVILPIEVNLDALGIAQKNELSVVDYNNLMLDRLDEASDERIKTLGEIERDKLRVARTYNKKIKENHFRSEILFGR